MGQCLGVQRNRRNDQEGHQAEGPAQDRGLGDLDLANLDFEAAVEEQEQQAADPAAALRAVAADRRVLYRPGGLGEGDGRAILAAIAAGEGDALDGLLGAVDAVPGGPLNAREWGLGRVGADHFIVFGNGVNVSWGALGDDFGMRPVAHSHPLNDERSLDDAVEILDDRLGAASHGDQCRIYPSTSDATVPALAGENVHHVYTPYVLHEADGRRYAVTPDDEHQGPRLTFRIDDPQVGAGIMTVCTLTLLAGAEVLIQGPASGLRFMPRGPLTWGAGDQGELDDLDD